MRQDGAGPGRSRWCRAALALAVLHGLAGPAGAMAQEPQAAPGLPVPEVLRGEGLIGLLSLPDRPARPSPAVLVLHDRLGPDLRSEPYARQLLGAGIAVLDLLAEAPDAAQRDAAAAALAADPRIDPRRLGALGFGAGAATAATAPLPARALLYPGCATLPPVALPGALLLMHGGADPANSPAACDALVAALARGGSQPRRVEYRDAAYAWDRPGYGLEGRAMVPAPDGVGRVLAQPWPALTALAASQVAGFFAMAFSP